MKPHLRHRLLLGALLAAVAGCDDGVSPPVPPVSGACTDYASHSHWAAAWDSERGAGRIALVGDVAYLLSGQNVDLADISAPQAPRWLGTTHFIDEVRKIVVRGDVAYAAGSASLLVLDVRDPANPQLLGNELLLDGVLDLDAAGGYVYVGTGTGLQVVDVRNPREPVHVAGVTFPAPVRQVAVTGGHAYVTTSYDQGLTVVDVHAPDAPRIAGHMPAPSFLADLAAEGRRLYATMFDRVAVIDVTDPVAPRIVDTAPTEATPSRMHAAGNRIYVAGTSASFQHHVQVFEVTPAGRPLAMVTLPMSGDVAPRGLAARGDDLFVADFRRGLQVFSVSAPRSLGPAGSFGLGDSVEDVAMAGSLLFAAAAGEQGLVVSDLADPEHPRILGHVVLPNAAEGVAVDGNYAYVTNWDAGLYILDIAAPASPQLVGSVDTPGYAQHVAAAGSFAYVADNVGGLQVVDVATPAAPRLVRNVRTTGVAVDVALQDGYAYVATSGALDVIDVRDPAAAFRVASAPCGFATSIVLQGSWAYVAGGTFDVFSIAMPESPARVASIRPPTEFRGIAVAGGVAYLADGQYGLVAFDTNNPSAPQVLGSIRMRGVHRAVIGPDCVVMAGWDAGVVLAPFHCR